MRGSTLSVLLGAARRFRTWPLVGAPGLLPAEQCAFASLRGSG